jgi:hypothetical protein
MYSYLLSFLLYTSFFIVGLDEMEEIGLILILSLEVEERRLLSLLSLGFAKI